MVDSRKAEDKLADLYPMGYNRVPSRAIAGCSADNRDSDFVH